MDIISTPRGGDKLILHDYTYISKTRKGGKRWWDGTKAKSLNCKGAHEPTHQHSPRKCGEYANCGVEWSLFVCLWSLDHKRCFSTVMEWIDPRVLVGRHAKPPRCFSSSDWNRRSWEKARKYVESSWPIPGWPNSFDEKSFHDEPMSFSWICFPEFDLENRTLFWNSIGIRD